MVETHCRLQLADDSATESLICRTSSDLGIAAASTCSCMKERCKKDESMHVDYCVERAQPLMCPSMVGLLLLSYDAVLHFS